MSFARAAMPWSYFCEEQVRAILTSSSDVEEMIAERNFLLQALPS